MSKQIQSKKFRIYPNVSQRHLLDNVFSAVRFIWNHRVQHFNYFNECGPNDEFKTIKQLKIRFPFLCNVAYNALEQKNCDFVETRNQYFDKKRKTQLGRMKFKSRFKDKNSFRLSYNGFSIKNIELYIGRRIGKVKIERGIDLNELCESKSITISKNHVGQYFVSFLYEKEITKFNKTGKSIGLDLGLSHFIIDSDSNKIENQRHYRKNQAKLKKLQQSMSRKKKGSNNHIRVKHKVGLLHLKISNQRNYFQHIISKEIIQQYDFIAIESLKVKNMMKNKCLSKAIADVSWSSFLTKLEYKAKWHDKVVVKIDTFFPSSKKCSTEGCDFKHTILPLSVRSWICPSCNVEHDRDVNAAKNILIEGLRISNSRTNTSTDVAANAA